MQSCDFYLFITWRIKVFFGIWVLLICMNSYFLFFGVVIFFCNCSGNWCGTIHPQKKQQNLQIFAYVMLFLFCSTPVYILPILADKKLLKELIPGITFIIIYAQLFLTNYICPAKVVWIGKNIDFFFIFFGPICYFAFFYLKSHSFSIISLFVEWHESLQSPWLVTLLNYD